MALENKELLNRLESSLPEGLIVDAAWLTARGYSHQLRRHYLRSGWLKRAAPRVYQRTRGTLSWQQVVISLQTLLEYDLVISGFTALEQQGYAHYLRAETIRVHLSGPQRPPTWLNNVLSDIQFSYTNDLKLFRTMNASTAPHELEPNKEQVRRDGTITKSWGQWSWPLCLSSPERAILELLNELPNKETFHQVDMVMEGLSTLSPTRLNKLLADCKSVKVKRLFLYFSERHNHAWFKRLDREKIDLGSGKRVIFKGGRLNKKYLITVPEELDELS